MLISNIVFHLVSGGDEESGYATGPSFQCSSLCQPFSSPSSSASLCFFFFFFENLVFNLSSVKASYHP